jgi:PTS system beta-glucosides-specific IIC component
MALAVALRVKDPNQKGVALGAFISGIIGGVSEPTLFGVGFKYNRCLKWVAVANAVVGVFVGVTHVYLYNLGATSILSLLSFISPDRPTNVIFAAIAGAIGFGLSLVLNYLFGLTKEQIEEGAPAEA